MTKPGFALFDTAIGACAVAWGAGGILGVQLPDADATRTRARMRRRFSTARETTPPAEVQRTIDGIVALIGGEAVDFSAVALDMERVPAFHRRVYDVARTISRGATLTYGEIAKRLGVPAEAREVGEAMGRNPFPIIVPCHRVLAAGGKLGGFSAPGGVATKRRLLAIEGARATEGPDLFDRMAPAD
ncbi:MAG TPA: methylated-DNA--[protein]-cysteine S-methyltransferase [Xanthobacteraceae bacterium]|jgi:methylated-DNA-[protein]-cysteine S-methyltransferase|nr:methylated-DNA--[protein]-cysteine S-methyltransferase [Xanthobacteraceae bacterium]